MATVMKKARERIYADALDQVPGQAALDNQRVEMNEIWQGPEPERFVVRTIDFDMIEDRLCVFFRDSDLVQPLGGQTIEEVVDGLLAPPAFAAKLATATATAASARPQTPLDLQIKNAATYVILILGKPVNMAFNPSLKAMTHKSAADWGNYGRLRHANGAGQKTAGPLDDCRLIYFVANPPYPPTYYQHGFNLNVRLDQGVGEDGLPRALDIEIDPDIRYPGGSVTEVP